MDISFGDCISVGGARYSIVFVDRATRYNWVFPLKTLGATDIRDAFNLFCAQARRFAKCFCADWDDKLLGKTTKAYPTEPTNNSDIIGAAAGYQSSNGLVKSHWKTMLPMSRAHLTKKQMPRRFLFHSIVHAAQMMNMIPGKLKIKSYPLSCSCMAQNLTSNHGFPFSPSAIFIPPRMATSNVPKTNQIQRTASSFSHIQCLTSIQSKEQAVL